MNTHYIYALLDPTKPGVYEYEGVARFKHEPFYIGKGKGLRAESHIKEAINTKRKTHKLNRIRKILKSGINPIIIRSRPMKEREATALEVKVIASIGRRSTRRGPLTNGTDGGDGVTGHVHKKSTRRKMSLKQKELATPATNKKRYANLKAYWDDPVKAAEGRRLYSESVNTPESKSKKSKSMKEMWKSWGPDKIRSREEKRLKSFSTTIKNNGELIADQKRNTRKSKGKGWEAEVQKRRLAALNNRSDSEKALTSQLRSKASKRYQEEQRNKKYPEKIRKQIRNLATHKNCKAISKELGLPYTAVLKIVHSPLYK